MLVTDDGLRDRAARAMVLLHQRWQAIAVTDMAGRRLHGGDDATLIVHDAMALVTRPGGSIGAARVSRDQGRVGIGGREGNPMLGDRAPLVFLDLELRFFYLIGRPKRSNHFR